MIGEYLSCLFFAFISPGRRGTNLTDILISDTYVLKVFDRFVNMKRLPLGEILSVDEGHLKIPGECEYALVLFDFTSRQPIDMIPSRRQSVTEPYFASIVDTKVGKVRPSNSPTESLNRRPKNQCIKKQWP